MKNGVMPREDSLEKIVGENASKVTVKSLKKTINLDWTKLNEN